MKSEDGNGYYQIINIMKVINILKTNNKTKIRLSADIVLDNGKTHNVFFEINNKFEKFVTDNASLLLPVTIPIGMKLKENIDIESNISKKIISNIKNIMQILENWNLGFKSVTINTRSVISNLKKNKFNGCLFSGGVDSFYTYFKNKNNINYLVFVHGFDINSDDIDLYKKIEKNINRIAKYEKMKIINVRTNVRDIFEQYFDWNMSHPFAIASVALFLSNGLKNIYVSCGLPNKNTDHHYMTPELDILWSTEDMIINHYGCSADKTTKLTYLSKINVAMENLRVCWVNKKMQYNCCECEKCLRNMLSLYTSGSLEKCKTFNKHINLNKLRNIRVSDYCLKYFISILEELKRKNINSVVTSALQECIDNNKSPKTYIKMYREFRDFIRYFDQKYNRNRLYWYLARKGMIS